MPLFAALESRVLMYFAGSLTVHLGFWLLLQQIPVEDSGTNIDLASLEDTSTRSNSTNQDDPPPPEEEDKPDDGNEESGGSGTAMTLDEGKMGKKDSTRAEGQYKMQKTSEDPQLARQQAIEQARTAGILGSSALVTGGAFASLTGTGDVSSGFDDSNIYGGLLGNEAGEMQGGFGFGRSGFGPGGGGTGWGTIGTGRYGTIGHGSGTGSGYGVGGGRGGMRGRSAAVPTVAIGQPQANGDLDKAIIRRYIKRNIQKITYCYEKQLLAKPGLSGTVATQFFITPNGNVATASGSGVDPEVANCVAAVIKGIEFPKPKGGGGVQVNYPFTFRPAG
jgi:outer membrane biosynthesis protein TonB